MSSNWMLLALLSMSIECSHCGATRYDASAAAFARSGWLGRCAACAQPRLVAGAAAPPPARPLAAPSISSVMASGGAGPDAERWAEPEPYRDGAQRLRRGNPARSSPDLSTPVTAPSPPLVPDIIDATATIPPRARPDTALSTIRRGARARAGLMWPRFLPAIAAMQLAAIAAMLLARAEIVRVLPESASLFGAIGLPVNLRGLVIAGLNTRIERQDGIAVLIVEGRIESDSRSTVAVPPLRLALRDAAGIELYAWTVPADAATLGAGESLAFHGRMASPPPGGMDVLARFALPSDG
jgi:hypothetical protein